MAWISAQRRFRLGARRAASAPALLLLGVAIAAIVRFGPFHGSPLPAMALSAAATPGKQEAVATEPETKPKPPAPRTSSMRGVLPFAAVMVAAFVMKGRLAANVETNAAATPPPKDLRIDAFDSMRFFLIFYIASGHFISFAKPSELAFKLITQINVVVGAFFALSGYVAAFSSCETGQKKAKQKILSTPAPTYILAKVFGFWPLHLFVLILFSPMFLYVDFIFAGPFTAGCHSLMSVTMIQAWFPMHAEVWNAPTWFLGALTFATVLTPYFLPVLAMQGKAQLRRTALWLTLFGLIPRLGYCYDTGAWGFLEGAMAPKAFPNLAYFNSMRFNPMWAVLEVMLGFVACRLVMLDGTDGEAAPKAGPADTFLPFIGMVAVLVLRATGVLALSDLLVRSCIFMPLFLLFLMGLHRASFSATVTDPLARLFAWRPLIWLGKLSFPIFVVHGPLGQLFYKKAVASKLFGGPMNVVVGPSFFYAYLLIVGAAAWLLNTFFMPSKTVAAWSKSTQAKLLKFL